MTVAKTSAQRFGKFAEAFSCWRLRLTGYRILQRGYQAAGGEIDIIARRGNILAFIEVKARKSLDDALHALGPQQRRRIERTALAFLAQNHQLSTCDARFDLIVQSPRSWPRHLTGAWIQGA
ncbi:MAG: YraN family protein [Rhodospirillaceae bacterium]|jgi:putative endonuclease|nr:YraN family protein [Rhodospirillaceae bacterium]MBT5243015.1 YraN family protein [Rhodospirillaceae bacterium]MBT5563240.1 YraN family protein [Rhodospirillaceae bacterium]MBT6243554.1 YraN family protein [Rhodospirillaceae bacterium]